MFMNTIAVGPLELVRSCVTGCTTVAIGLEDRENHGDDALVIASCDALLATCGTIVGVGIALRESLPNSTALKAQPLQNEESGA